MRVFFVVLSLGFACAGCTGIRGVLNYDHNADARDRYEREHCGKGDYEALMRTGEAARRAGKFGLAFHCFSRARKQLDTPEARVGLTLAAIQGPSMRAFGTDQRLSVLLPRDRQRALLRSALKENPTVKGAHLALGLLGEADDPEQGLRELDIELATHPSSEAFEAHRRLAAAAEERKQKQEERRQRELDRTRRSLEAERTLEDRTARLRRQVREVAGLRCNLELADSATTLANSGTRRQTIATSIVRVVIACENISGATVRVELRDFTLEVGASRQVRFASRESDVYSVFDSDPDQLVVIDKFVDLEPGGARQLALAVELENELSDEDIVQLDFRGVKFSLFP